MTHVLAIPDELATRLQRVAASLANNPPDGGWRRLALCELESLCDVYEQDHEDEASVTKASLSCARGCK